MIMLFVSVTFANSSTEILKYIHQCENIRDSWKISYFVNATIKTVLIPKCKVASSINRGIIELDISDHKIYNVSTAASSFLPNSYLILTDLDDTILFKKNIYPNKPFEGIFTIDKPIEKGFSMLYSKDIQSDNWYHDTYIPTEEWILIEGGTIMKNISNNQYYRIEFDIYEYKQLSSYILNINVTGNITIYINNYFIWNGYWNLNENKETLRLILSSYPLLYHNLIAIKVENNNIDIDNNTYIDIIMSLRYSEEGNGCSVLGSDYSVSGMDINSVTLFDYDFKTTYTYKGDIDISVDLSLYNNTYISINRFQVIENPRSINNIHSYWVKGRNNDHNDWNTIDNRENINMNDEFKIFDNDANIYPYNSFQLYLTKNEWNSTAEYPEILFFTCNRYPMPLQYLHDDYSVTLYFHNIISPVYTGYTGFTITPSLPKGLSIHIDTGAISGIPTERTPKTLYTIQAAHPYPTTTFLNIETDLCSSSHIKIVRHYGYNTKIYSESFIIRNKETKEIIYEEKENTIQQLNTTIYHEFCIPSVEYTIEFNNQASMHYTRWEDDSTLSIYKASKYITSSEPIESLDHYILIFKEKRDQKGSKNYIIQLKDMVSIHSTWKHNEGSIPDNWYSLSYIDSDWEKIIMGENTISKSIHLFRKNIELTSIDVYSIADIRVQYYSGIIIYINGNEIFRNHLETNIITPSTYATSIYSELIFRRITVPLSSFIIGMNSIAIMFIPHKNEPTTNYIMDISIRDVGKGDTRAIYDIYTDTNKENVINMNYHEYMFLPATDNTISISSYHDEYSTLTHYAMYTDYSVYTNMRPFHWALQGRSTNQINNTWVTIDEQTNINWDLCAQRRIFAVIPEKMKLYNEYRFIDISGFNDKLKIYQIELYSSSLSMDIPLFSYKNTTVYVNTYIEELVPSYSYYYTNYTIYPSLPEGLTLNTVTGVIRGIPKWNTNNNHYRISAKSYDNTIYTNDIYINIINCTGNKSVIGLDIQYYNNYRFLEITVEDVSQVVRKVVYYNESIQDNYREFIRRDDPSLRHLYIPICLNSSSYEIKLIPRDYKRFLYPCGYIVSTPSGTLYKEGDLYNNEIPTKISIDTYIPIQSFSTVWKYIGASNEMSDWFEKDFDDSHWSIENNNYFVLNNQKHLYLRSYFDVPSISSHISIDLNIQTKGTLIVYINQLCVYINNTISNSIQDHLFTIPIQLYSIKSTHNLIAIYTCYASSVKDTNVFIDSSYISGTITQLLNTFTYTSNSLISRDYPLQNMMTKDYYTYTEFLDDSIIIDIFMNKEQSFPFNSIFIQTLNYSQPTGISIYAKEKENYQWISIVDKKPIEGEGRISTYISIPQGLAKFSYYQIHFFNNNNNNNNNNNKMKINTNNTLSTIISYFTFIYISTSQSLCPSTNTYISVGENEYSYALCEDGYEGYMFSQCDGFHFGASNKEYCIPLRPNHLEYPQKQYTLYTYTDIKDIIPTYDNIINFFSIVPTLPEGIYMNKTTGIISGIPKLVVNNSISYSITGYNPSGTISTSILININSGYCMSTSEYPKTDVFSKIEIPCIEGYIGIQYKYCELDENNHIYWGHIENNCNKPITMEYIDYT
ncbi:hypothetical protein WA158_008505 [Blastocystis sp. Blastoise]